VRRTNQVPNLSSWLCSLMSHDSSNYFPLDAGIDVEDNLFDERPQGQCSSSGWTGNVQGSYANKVAAWDGNCWKKHLMQMCGMRACHLTMRHRTTYYNKWPVMSATLLDTKRLTKYQCLFCFPAAWSRHSAQAVHQWGQLFPLPRTWHGCNKLNVCANQSNWPSLLF
jgi:hypothetical protein